MKIVAWLFLLFPMFAFCQLEIKSLDKKEIPSSITYYGNIQNAVLFTDAYGKHIAITTEMGGKQTRDAELYAYLYSLKNGIWSLDWKVYDFEKDCSLDLLCNYIPGSFAVTDLDTDGKAEVWLMYELTCTGDISPSVMKVIMYENGLKHAMRGERRIVISENPKEYFGGDYNFDVTFKNAPITFKVYAQNLWKKYVDINLNKL